MPIYEYRCSGCDSLIEKICRSDVQTIDCPQCGKPAQRVVSVFSTQSSGSAVSAPACRPASGFT